MFDRSGEFQRLTLDLGGSGSGKKRDRIGTDGPPPLPQDLESAILRTVPLDEFLSSQESVKVGCDRIEKLKGEIEQLHRNALMTVDEEDAVRIGKKIEAVSLLAATESSNVRRLLKSIDEETRRQEGLSESDLRLRQSKQRALCKRFMKLMEDFEVMQKECKAKYQKQMERQFLLVKPDATEKELAALRESPQAMSQQIFSLANKLQASQNLKVMRERQEEIQKLEKNMTELHEMFLDISFLVSQQGYTIDRVEEYVDASREATGQAAAVMTEVVVKQKKAQRRRWFMAGLGTIILVILIVIIVLALTNNL